MSGPLLLNWSIAIIGGITAFNFLNKDNTERRELNSTTGWDASVNAGFGDFFIKQNNDWNHDVQTKDELSRRQNPTPLYNTKKYKYGQLNAWTEIYLNENGTTFDSEYSSTRIPANGYSTFIDGTHSPCMYR